MSFLWGKIITRRSTIPSISRPSMTSSRKMNRSATFTSHFCRHSETRLMSLFFQKQTRVHVKNACISYPSINLTPTVQKSSFPLPITPVSTVSAPSIAAAHKNLNISNFLVTAPQIQIIDDNRVSQVSGFNKNHQNDIV